jgi:hypothetical protein
MGAKEQQFQAFQEFQKVFFTSPERFSRYTNFEVNKHAFILLTNISKGFPAMIDQILNLKGFGWTGFQSLEILRALQMKLINPYTGNRLPPYLFYKTQKATKEKSKKTDKGLEFAPDVVAEICSILKMDSKTFDYLKYSPAVQNAGRQIIGDFREVEKSSKKKS